MKKVLIISFIFFLGMSTNAQLENQQIIDKPERNWSYILAYSGNNLWNPGLKFGGEIPLGKRVQSKNIQLRKDTYKTKIKTRAINTSGEVGFFWDPFSHVSSYVNIGVNYRRYSTYGFYYQIGFQPLGLQYSFFPETYEYSNDGSISRLTFPGRLYYAPVLSVGIGKSLLQNLSKAFYMKLNTHLLSPYNTLALPILTLDIGKRF